ncbi:MAG: hypothetical protein KDA74_19480, partial [Planctomycetaceae bacterium]|nr:hypothetical protein [Planctomycetaceae bacterium]
EFQTSINEQTELSSLEHTDRASRKSKSRPLPIESRIPFSGRQAESHQINETAGFAPEPQQAPRTSLTQEREQFAQAGSQPRRAPERRAQPQPTRRYSRVASPARGIDLGETAEIDF